MSTKSKSSSEKNASPVIEQVKADLAAGMKLGWNGSVDQTVPTQTQLDFLVKNGVDADAVKSHTRAECSARIKLLIADQRADRELPPTEPQLTFLAKNGYNRVQMAVRTKGYCSYLIYKIKTGKAA